MEKQTTLEQTAKDLKEMFKKEEQEAKDKNQYVKELEHKITTLEKVLINLSDRVDYLESQCK